MAFDLCEWSVCGWYATRRHRTYPKVWRLRPLTAAAGRERAPDSWSSPSAISAPRDCGDTLPDVLTLQRNQFIPGLHVAGDSALEHGGHPHHP